VLADELLEPGRAWDALHAAGGVDRRWKSLKGWTKVWSCERHAETCRWPEGLKAEFLGRVFPFKHFGRSSK
jgi:hypothetical protein